MNKAEFISRVTSNLREHKVRKIVPTQDAVFYISDDNGRSAKFTVQQDEREVAFTGEDINNIMDACFGVIEDMLRHGETLILRGLMSIGVTYHEPRITKDLSGELCSVPGRYVPKVSFGNTLRMAAMDYTGKQNDKEKAPKPPTLKDAVYDEYDY